MAASKLAPATPATREPPVATPPPHPKMDYSLVRVIDSILVGYRMSMQRVDRALQKAGLEPIPTVGQPFDPELMEVMEVTLASGRPAGEVLEEVRKGYLWNGRVFRYAQVRVAK
jgi:molecular chaperone GrpE